MFKPSSSSSSSKSHLTAMAKIAMSFVYVSPNFGMMLLARAEDSKVCLASYDHRKNSAHIKSGIATGSPPKRPRSGASILPELR